MHTNDQKEAFTYWILITTDFNAIHPYGLSMMPLITIIMIVKIMPTIMTTIMLMLMMTIVMIHTHPILVKMAVVHITHPT